MKQTKYNFKWDWALFIDTNDLSLFYLFKKPRVELMELELEDIQNKTMNQLDNGLTIKKRDFKGHSTRCTELKK